MSSLAYYFGVFRQSATYVFSRLAAPPGLLLFFWLEKTLAFLRPVSVLFFVPYFLLQLNYLQHHKILAAYSLFIFLFLVFFIPQLRKDVYTVILNSVYEWYSNHVFFRLRDLWRLSKILHPLHREAKKALVGINQLSGFYYKLFWFSLRANKNNNEFDKIAGNNIYIQNYVELLNRRFAAVNWVYRGCFIALLFLCLAWLFPIQYQARQFGGLQTNLAALDLTATSVAFFSFLCSMLLALFELFCFLPWELALISHCYFSSNNNEVAVQNILQDTREMEREGKLVINGQAVDDFRLEFVFLISLLGFSVLISLLWPFVAVWFVFALYFLLPSVYQKISRSRLFLALHVVGHQKSQSFLNRLLFLTLNILLMIQLLVGGLHLVDQLPIIFNGFYLTKVLEQRLLFYTLLFILPLLSTVFLYKRVEKGFFSQKKRMLEALSFVIWQNIFLLVAVCFLSTAFGASMAGMAGLSLIILNKLKRSF